MFNRLARAAIAAAFALSGAVSATTLTLPTPNELSAGTYNDFLVYSVNLLQQCAAANDPRCLPAIGAVQSGGGQIDTQAVVLAGANGNQLDNFFQSNPFSAGTAADNSFLTPSGGTTSYQMSDTSTFTGDRVNRWDIKLSALQSYLDGNDLFFIFDNNQAQNSTTWLSFWAQARIVDAAGNTQNNLCFELSSGSGCTGTAPSNNYVVAASNFCVDKTTGASYAPNGNSCGANGYYVNNNLGTNQAEFIAFNQALNDAAANPLNGDLYLSLNVYYTGNNGGAEQLWICSDCKMADTTKVPEPGTVPLLMGAALMALAYRRKQQ